MPDRSRRYRMRALVAAALFLAGGPAGLALAAGAAAQASSQAGTRTTTAPTGGAAATSTPGSVVAIAMARPRQAAVDEAHRLLLLARLPPGATRTASAPPGLAGGPALGTPGVSSLVVQTQYWRVPMSFDQAQAWLEGHPPAGLKPAGSSTGGGASPSDMTTGYGYTALSTAQLQSPELEVGVAYVGPSVSAVRVDAVVIWTDPRPWPDSATGKRAHVTVAGGCPARVAGVVGVTNPGAGLTASLLPPGSPTAALVCRYDGSDGPSGSLPASQWQKLAHQARLTATGARELARVVDAAPTSRTVVPGGGAFAPAAQCPMDDGAVAIVAFSYPGRPDVDLWAQLSGCAVVGNGFILGSGAGIASRVKLYG